MSTHASSLPPNISLNLLGAEIEQLHSECRSRYPHHDFFNPPSTSIFTRRRNGSSPPKNFKVKIQLNNSSNLSTDISARSGCDRLDENVRGFEQDAAPSPFLLVVVGLSISLFASNLYYAQPLLTTIASDLHLAPSWAGSIVSAGQVGYALGLLMLVPMADSVENKRLVLICWFFTLIGLIGLATAQSAAVFLFSAAVVGFFSSGAQILLPYLSHIIPELRRGRVIGAIMAGVLTSVMLARPFALFVASAFDWRAVYYLSGVATFSAGAVLWRTMPARMPNRRIRYRETLLSMCKLFRNEAEVKRRTVYQALLFASFTMFWTVSPIVLTEHFAFSQTQIGLFALAGAGGVFAAPLAGRVSDRGSTRAGTTVASLLVVASFSLSIWSVETGILLALVSAAVVIDASIQTAQVLSRIVVLEVNSKIRGRINALYMTIVYLSGAAGSILGVSLYFSFGWTAVAILGVVAGLGVLVGVMTESSRPRPALS